jgi:hypothetical protein
LASPNECVFVNTGDWQKMSLEQEPSIAREAVGVFNRSEDLQDAIDELLSSGFDRAEPSLFASERAAKEKLGDRYEMVNALADDATVPRGAYVSAGAVGDPEGGLIGGLMYAGRRQELPLHSSQHCVTTALPHPSCSKAP